MPTILRAGPWRVYFCSHEPNEPAHVHVDRVASSAKFWLVPVACAGNDGFSARELRQIERLVREHQRKLKGAWDEFFGTERG